MPVVNPLARELVFKVVYYGPGLGGKTTSLQYIHATAKPEQRGKMVSLATPVDRTLYFDFLPVRVPNVRGMSVKLQLFTVPGQVHYNATRKLVLTGADGIVLVYDSQAARADANLETLDNLRENLAAQGRRLSEMPHVVQYNKRDLFDVVPLEELERKLNRGLAPSFATTATNGEGVYESLEAITRALLADFERRAPGQRVHGPTSLELPEGGLGEALRRAEDNDAWGEELAEHAARSVQRRPSDFSLLSNDPALGLDEPEAYAVAPDSGREPPSFAARDAQGPASVVAPAQHAWVTTVPSMSEPAPAARVTSVHPAPSASSDATSFSFASFWPSPERSAVGDLEAALGTNDWPRVVTLADQLVARALASAADLLGASSEAPRDPATVALLVGLEGRRYLQFRAMVKDVRGGGGVGMREALQAYAMAIEVRVACAQIQPRS